MKTLGMILNEIDLERKRNRTEQVKSILPYLDQLQSGMIAKRKLEQDKADLEAKRQYEENLYNDRLKEKRTYAEEQEKEQRTYNEGKETEKRQYEERKYRERLSNNNKGDNESMSGLNFFDSIKKPADYLKYVDKKVESETYTKRDGSEGGANYVYIRKNGKITKIPVQRSANGVYTWNNGNPIDLSKTLDLEEINKANSMGNIDTIDIHYNADDARGVLPEKTNKKAPANNGTKGNIDTSKIDPVKNKDGSFSTVRSISINEDGKEILIPTVIKGKVVSDKMAIDHYHKTNQHLGKFDTVEEANAYAKKLHEEEETRISKKQNAVQKKNKNNEVAISEYFKKYARK